MDSQFHAVAPAMVRTYIAVKHIVSATVIYSQQKSSRLGLFVDIDLLVAALLFQLWVMKVNNQYRFTFAKDNHKVHAIGSSDTYFDDIFVSTGHGSVK